MTSEKDRSASCFHEAGHVVVGVTLGSTVNEADISSGDLVVTRFDCDELFDYDAPTELAERYMAMAWSGVLAQERAGHPDLDGVAFGRPLEGEVGASPGSDLDSLTDLVIRFDSPDAPVLFDRSRTLAEATLAEHWPAVEAVSSALMKAGRLDAQQLVAIIDAAGG